MSLRRADIIMASSKSRFYCIRGKKKANSVSVNNFNKIKNMFIIFVGNIKKSNMQLTI